MKKLSISLFAALAVVLAVSSAFTTTKGKSTTDFYEIWGINDVVTNLSPSFATISSASKDLLKRDVAAFDFDGAGGSSTTYYVAQLGFAYNNQASEPFNEISTDVDVTCPGSGQVCLAYVFDDDGNSTDDVKAIYEGVYELVDED